MIIESSESTMVDDIGRLIFSLLPPSGRYTLLKKWRVLGFIPFTTVAGLLEVRSHIDLQDFSARGLIEVIYQSRENPLKRGLGQDYGNQIRVILNETGEVYQVWQSHCFSDYPLFNRKIGIAPAYFPGNYLDSLNTIHSKLKGSTANAKT